jgi:AcrR family transcriptional regulator
MPASTTAETASGPATGGRGRGYAKGRAKRAEIIQTAILAFAEVGYHGASLRDIAARADISHPGLLHHFPTKAALLEAVLEYRDAVDNEAFAEDMARGTDYFEALVRVVERNQVRRPLVELFAGLSTEATTPDHPAHEYFRRRYDRLVEQSTEVLEALAARGGLAPGVDPAQAARSIIALMDGLQVQWLLSLDGPRSERVDMAAHLRGYLALVLH